MKWDWKQMRHQFHLYTDYINKWAKTQTSWRKYQKFIWTQNNGLEVNAEKIMCHISSECIPNL